MSDLICPKCLDGSEKWVSDTDTPDLLEKGIMACNSCGHTLIGIPGYMASYKFLQARRSKGYRQDKRIRRRWKRYTKQLRKKIAEGGKSTWDF